MRIGYQMLMTDRAEQEKNTVIINIYQYIPSLIKAVYD